MQKRINGKLCDTETATLLGGKNVGEYGDPTGYEEKLYANRMKQHFIYGNGGLESKYMKPTMALFTEEEASAWLKENNIAAETPEAKAAAPRAAKTKAGSRTSKTKEAKKPASVKAKSAKTEETKAKTEKSDKVPDDAKTKEETK